MIGKIDAEGSPSAYNPSQAVKDLTADVQKTYSYGNQILNRAWPELNNYSVLEDMNNGRLMFNAFVDENVEDPAQAWKWRGTRSMARNKGIAMHAQLTMSYMLPAFTAQNERSEVDRDMSNFMDDLVEWMTNDQNSDYKSNFLSLVFAMESDPIVYLGAEWNKVMQTIKLKQEDGSYTTKEILDEVLSGFHAPIYTADQVLVTNAYERNLQKHRRIIKRRWIEYDEAKAKHGDNAHWDAVHAGLNTVYNSEDGLFYDIKDDDHPNLVEECVMQGRREDTEITFVAGVYMGDENIENNPMKHRDNFDAPRYNITPFGYYPIGSHFMFYKSMMNSMRWDNMLYDAMAEIVMNRSILEVDFPVAVSGSDKIDTEIAFPNAVVTFSDKDTKVTPLLPPSNLGAGYKALEDTKNSISEASLSDTATGQLPGTAQRAYVVAQAQANAKKLIADVAKGLAISVSRYGLLVADIAINHLTVPEVDSIVGSPLKYKSFLLPDQNVGGKTVAKHLTFDENLMGKQMSKEAQDQYNLHLLEKVSYPDNERHIYVANPEMFAKMKYLCTADYNELFPKDDEHQQAMLTALYAQLNADPMIEREALLRKVLYSYFKGESDDLIATQPAGGMQGLPAQVPGQAGAGGGSPQPSQALNTALSTGPVASKVLT